MISILPLGPMTVYGIGWTASVMSHWQFCCHKFNIVLYPAVADCFLSMRTRFKFGVSPTSLYVPKVLFVMILFPFTDRTSYPLF